MDKFSSFDVVFEKIVDRVQRDDPGLSRDEAVLKASELADTSRAYAESLWSASPDTSARDQATADALRSIVKRGEGDTSPEAVSRWLASDEGRRWYAANY